MKQPKQKLPRYVKNKPAKPKKIRPVRTKPPKPPKQKKAKVKKDDFPQAEILVESTMLNQGELSPVAEEMQIPVESESVALPEESKTEEGKKARKKKSRTSEAPKKGRLKNALIVVLVAVIVIESAVLVAGKGGKGETAAPVSAAENTPFVLNIDVSGIGNQALEDISKTAVEAVNDIKNGIKPKLDIMPLVEKTVFSDSIVSTVMSMSYPLLFKVLTDLNMMDFAENVSLYPTPVQLASLFTQKGYSCLTAQGERKPLHEVLTLADGDWGYMDKKVTVTDKEGKAVETTVWNTIVWGVKDKNSFYTAMNDMSEGIRGVLEICLQGKEKLVNINLVEFLLKTDKANIGLDAATVFNGKGKSGYELCLVPLFTMLGLTEGEYKTVEEFCGYTAISDMWRGILDPVFFAVEKIMKNPLPGLCNLLINFVDAVETGSLAEGMKSLQMDGAYHKLAKTFMKFEDGLLFNLGEALLEILGSAGIKLDGSFNGILDSLIQTVLKNPTADLPDMDIAALKACATETTLPNGLKVWQADTDKVVDYFIDYALQGDIIKLVLSLTPLAGTPEAERIAQSLETSREGMAQLVDVVLDMVLQKLSTVSL